MWFLQDKWERSVQAWLEKQIKGTSVSIHIRKMDISLSCWSLNWSHRYSHQPRRRKHRRLQTSRRWLLHSARQVLTHQKTKQPKIKKLSYLVWQVLCWNRYLTGLLIFTGANLGLTLVATILVVVFAPTAAGPGIPEIKAYLNGVDTPNMFGATTMIVKVLLLRPSWTI